MQPCILLFSIHYSLFSRNSKVEEWYFVPIGTIGKAAVRIRSLLRNGEFDKLSFSTIFAL